MTRAPGVAAMLAEFRAAFAAPFDPELPRRLQAEEGRELLEAIDSGDDVAIAHELADVVYVAYWYADWKGWDLDAVIAEVHRANMAKLGPDGRPVLREDGKILKPPGWRPADVAAVLKPGRAY